MAELSEIHRQQPKEWVLVHGSGFWNATTNAVNLGDAAQLTHALRGLKALGHRVVVLSNSSSDRSHDGTYAPRPLYPRALFNRAMSRSKPLAAIRMGWLILSAMTEQLIGLPLPAGRAGRVLQRRIKYSRTVFVSGAGAFNDNYLGTSVSQWFATGLMARIYRKRLVLVGQQIGPLRMTPMKRMIFKAAFGHAVLIGCRDQQSMTVARELGLPPSVILYTGDEGAHVDAVSSAKPIERPYLAVHLRFDENCRFEPHLKWYADLVQSVSDQAGLKVALISMDPGPTSGDAVALRALAALLGPDVPILRSNRPEIVKGWLSEAALALGVANHFLVFAASAGIPCVGVYTTEYMRQKCDGISHQYEHAMSFPASETAPWDLCGRILELRSRAKESTFNPLERFDWTPYV